MPPNFTYSRSLCNLFQLLRGGVKIYFDHQSLMEIDPERQFRELNEQLKLWNSYIDRTNKAILTTSDLIRTIPNQLDANENDSYVADVVKQNSFSMINKMPVLSYSIPPKKLPLLHFETTEPEIYEILDGRYKLKLTSNGWFPSKLSCIKFADNNTYLSVAGNSFFFSINYEIRAAISSWFAVSKSAENMVIDFDTSVDKAALAMEDNFIRIINYKTQSVISEFPAVIMNPTFLKFAHNDFVVVANDRGEVAYQKIDNIEGIYEKNIPDPLLFKISEKPIECKFIENGNIMLITDTKAYELDIISENKGITEKSKEGLMPKKNFMVEKCENGFRVFDENGSSSNIPLTGVDISAAAISRSENPKVAIGTTEGCLYIWEMVPNIVQQKHSNI